MAIFETRAQKLERMVQYLILEVERLDCILALQTNPQLEEGSTAHKHFTSRLNSANSRQDANFHRRGFLVEHGGNPWLFGEDTDVLSFMKTNSDDARRIAKMRESES